MRSRFPHGGEVLGAAPANPILAPVLSQDRGLSMSRQRELLDLQAIQRISGLVGYWKADPQYLFEDSAGTTPASTNGTGVVGLAMAVNSAIKPWRLQQRLGTEASAYSMVGLNSGVILAGTYSSAMVYRSTDNGLTWVFAQRLGSETYTQSFLDLGSGVVLAGTTPTGRIYKSADSGQTWGSEQRLGSETSVYCMVSLGSGVLLAGTGPTGQVYRSTDSGLNWSLVQRLGSEAIVRNFVNLGSGVVLAGTGTSGKIYKSTDNGLTWGSEQSLGSETNIRSLISLGSGVILAGTGPNCHIYRSADGGLNWSFIKKLGPETIVYSMVYLGSGVVLAGTDATAQIYRSTDSGLTWNLVQRLGSEQYVFSLLSLGSGVVLAGTNPTGQVYRSVDYGAPSLGAIQETTANKPILRKTPTTGVYWADSNTSTSALNVALSDTVLGRRNFMAYSENLATYWSKPNTASSSNTHISPDGTQTANTLTESTVTGGHILSQPWHTTLPTGGTTIGQQYTSSIFAKKGDGATAPDYIQLVVQSDFLDTIGYANFNISNGTIGNSSANVTPSITLEAGGFYRISITWVATKAFSTAGAKYFLAFTNNSGTAVATPSYAGATTSDVVLWGAQLNLGGLLPYQTYNTGVGGCTVARATPDGVTFTDNAEISPTYNIAPAFSFNSDVAIFNRALTATEKALITRYMARAVPMLGSNLVTNGTFDTDTTGWNVLSSSLVTVEAGWCRIQNDGAAQRYITQQRLTIGNQYLITALARGDGVATMRIGMGDSNLPYVVGTSSTSTQSLRLVGRANSTYVRAYNLSLTTTGVYAEFDNITAQEIL